MYKLLRGVRKEQNFCKAVAGAEKIVKTKSWQKKLQIHIVRRPQVGHGFLQTGDGQVGDNTELQVQRYLEQLGAVKVLRYQFPPQ